MFKKFIYFFNITALFLFLNSCSSFKTLKAYYVSDKITISNKQLSRLKNYLSGEIYSYEIERFVYASPLAFLISKDGKKSIILACEGIDDNCNIHVQIFQLIQKYNKKENDSFKILALKRKIVKKNNNLIGLSKNAKFSKILKDKKIFFDKILVPTDHCSDEDC